MVLKNNLICFVFVVSGAMYQSLQAEGESLLPLKGSAAPQTIQQLWAGYDPRTEPLEIEALKEWEEDDVVLRIVRYRIGIFKGKKAKMAGVYGYPKGGRNLPGLVQIHGGGQYADYRAVLANARRGYSTISIAWAGRISAPGYVVNKEGVQLFWEGKTEDPRYKLTTDWGAVDGYHAPGRNPGNVFPSAKAAAWTLDNVESPRNSGWFLCALAARRALTFLEEQPQVDPDRLGIYGHSMGGKLTVMTAMDPRVKAAAPSCGGISDRHNQSPLYRATLGDDVSLKEITCPIIFLSPSNDFHGRICDLPKAIAEIGTDQWRVTCSSHHNHQDTAQYEVATMLWMDQHLRDTFSFPQTPETTLTLKTDDGVPSFGVRPDRSRPVVSVDVFYTQHGKTDEGPEDMRNTVHRFWHHAETEQIGGVWTARLPLSNIEKPLWVYANITYPLDEPISGAGYYYGDYTAESFNVSSMLQVATAEELAAAGVRATREPSLLIESFEGDWEKEWFTYKPDEWARSTHKISDETYAAPTDVALAIDVLAEQSNTMVVVIDDYAAETQLRGSDQWQTVVLRLQDFHNAGGDTLVSWKDVRRLKLVPEERLNPKRGSEGNPKQVGKRWNGASPRFRNLRWQVPGSSETNLDKACPVAAEDYSFGYWLNGWRKSPQDKSPDVLCIESGRFGFMLDVDDLANPRLGLLDDDLDYAQALETGAKRIGSLPPAKLSVEIEIDDKVYQAVTCKAGVDSNVGRLSTVRLWESGRFVQHFDLLDLKFEDKAGNRLDCEGIFDLLAWPGSLTLTAELTPGRLDEKVPVVWRDAKLSVRLTGDPGEWHVEKRISGIWRAGQRHRATLTCNMPGAAVLDNRVSIEVSTPGRTWPVTFAGDSNCMKANIKGLQRTWKTGYTDIRNYDDFEIVVGNPGKRCVRVPFLLDLSGPANITGLCPIMCDKDGVPTGIPVQLSKNWHYRELGAYLRAYTLLPASPGKSRYKLRIAYGFYGTLPSASHAQLSLVGWGRNGRWDQLAIGCWGETMCLDMDMSATDIAITDVRMLMTRNGLKGRKWSWTDAGWGGDWLGIHDASGHKLAFTEMKTAYLSHGPCLTEVRYDGCYGPERDVDVVATVRTLRTNDYARTFHMLDYQFCSKLSADTAWLFKMGRTGALVTPQIAYGNEAGLIAEQEVPLNLKPDELFVDKVKLSGEGPWWVAFPGALHLSGKNWGTGSRALVIRSYRAVFDGRPQKRPTISMPVHKVQRDGRCDLDLLLIPPEGVKQFKPGDKVEMDLEWITLPRVADDYYGPNEAFRTHLVANPCSWKTVYREAFGNDLNITLDGGAATHNYPIIIQASRPEVRVEISGGVGVVPIRFDGLQTASDYRLYRDVNGQLISLDQSVHGKDYWQTDYDAASNTFGMSLNLPLDGIDSSRWVFKQMQNTD
jgi:hypothetical protein